MNFFSDLETNEIDNIFKEEKNINNIKILLANEATKILHGANSSKKAEKTAKQTFDLGGTGKGLPELYVRSSDVDKGINFIEFLSKNKILTSKSEARRVIANRGFKIDNVVVEDKNKMLKTSDFKEKTLKLSYGKKKHFLVKIT